MTTFSFVQDDFVSWLKDFALCLHSPMHGNDLILPSSLGEGRMIAQAPSRDMSFIVMDFTLKEDLVLIRKPTTDYGILLFFNQVTVGDFFRIRSGKEELKEFTKSRSNIFLSSTNMDMELHYSKGSTLKRVGIYFSPVMVRKFVKDDMQLFLTVYTDQGLKNVNRETINFELKSILDDIFRTSLKDDFGRLILQNRVLMLTEKFLHNLLAKEVKSDKKSYLKKEDIEGIQTVERVLTQADLDKFPSVESLSRMAMMSSTKLKTKFKEVYGMKLYEYYNRHRLLKAKEMITVGRSSVKDAAYSIGFSNLSNFSRAFKKEFGVLPGQIK
jgi:AraC-like DNA-binding protein